MKNKKRTPKKIGRPPISDEPMEDKSAYLPRSYAEAITAFGNGNFSAGVRKLWEWYQSKMAGK